MFKGDDELLRFVQRLLGCALAGLVHEHVLPIFWGSGRNGKGTLLEVVAGVLGPELAVPVPADALMEQRKGSDGPQPYLYALRGKRLAWASESNEGRRVDAALVKQLTGGDLLHVRTLHGKPVMFEPTHLLLLLTNHKPHLAADDPAVWERVLLVPFTERFVAEPGAGEKQREAGLKEALLAEGAEILAWLVRGCMGWQMLGGLRPPAVVKAATAAYREEEDDLKPFLAERCVQRAECQIAAKLGYTFAAKLVQIVGDDGLSLLRYG